MLLIFALVIVISSIAIFTYIYSGYHFHKNVFTDQGYLTNTLPVTPSQLLLSKELAALLWLLIDVVVISISIFILVGSTEPVSYTHLDVYKRQNMMNGDISTQNWILTRNVPRYPLRN